MHLLHFLRMWAFQLFHFTGSGVQFSRQVGVGGIYRYLWDIRDITERGRPHLQSLTVTSLKSSGSWGLYLPFSLNFPFSLYFQCSSLHFPLSLNFLLSLCFHFFVSLTFLGFPIFKTTLLLLMQHWQLLCENWNQIFDYKETLELRIVKVQFCFDWLVCGE